jgi:hypothetical protein
MNYVENFKSPQFRNLFKIFKSSSIKSFNIFGARESSFLNLQVWVEFGILKFYFTGPGPPVSGPRRFPTACTGDRAHMPLTTDPITMQWSHSWQRAHMRQSPPITVVFQRWGGLTTFPSSSRAAFATHPPLCLTCAHHSAHRRVPPHPTPSPSEPRNLTAVFHWRCSSTSKLEPPATTPGRAPSSSASSSVSGLLSTTMLRPPLSWPTAPQSSSLFLGASRPRVLLWQPHVRAVIVNHLTTDCLAIDKPRWWACILPTTSHRLPVGQDSSLATPALPPRRWLVRISRRGNAGEGGMDPLFWSTGLKGSGGPDRFRWLGRVHYGPSPVA